jgi:hypothetical protein
MTSLANAFKRSSLIPSEDLPFPRLWGLCNLAIALKQTTYHSRILKAIGKQLKTQNK